MGDEEPVRALRRLLRTDPGYAGEPRRLGRGLLDLLPHDDRAVRLLVLGAEVGVPGLVAGGQLADARGALTDRAGLAAGAAGWVVAVWLAAGRDNPVGGVGPVRLAAWPDGTLLVVTRESRGVFAATVGESGPSPWRLLAPAAGAGTIAVSVEGERAVVAWPGAGGVYALEAHLRGTLDAGPPEPVAEARPGLHPGTPFALVAVDETLNQFVWAADGRLRRGTWRAWPSDEPDVDLPPVGAAVTALGTGRPTPGTALLVAGTAAGRVLTAGWDLPGEFVSAWHDIGRPAADTFAAAGAQVFVSTADGRITGDPGGQPHPVDGRLAAATTAGDTTWLATVTAGTIILSRPDSGAAWSLPAP